MGRYDVERRTFSGGNSAAAADYVGKDNDWGGMATLTPPFAAKLWETTMTTTTMATTITSPATIKSTGAAMVLVPHGAKLPPPLPLPTADLTLLPLLSNPTPSVNAPTHTSSNATDALTYASFFVLGWEQRDDGADGIVVVGGDGGTRGGVDRGCRSSADDYGNANCNDILCLTKL
jgi:hypothetical protein